MSNLIFDALDTSNHPECIITGCSLFAPELDNCHVNGDLFQLGDCYIFNAAPQMLGPKDYTYSKQVHVASHFARRHVYVFAKSACELNDAAKEYIA